MILFNSKYKGRSVNLKCPDCYSEIKAYAEGTEDLIQDPPLWMMQRHFCGWVVRCPNCNRNFLVLGTRIKED